MYPQRVTETTIRVLIIQPDDTYELRDIEQDLQTTQVIVGGYPERVNTPYGDLWFNKESEVQGCPANMMATYLWWKLCPEMEGLDILRGPVFITGTDDDAGYSMPVTDAVVDTHRRMEAVRHREED